MTGLLSEKKDVPSGWFDALIKYGLWIFIQVKKKWDERLLNRKVNKLCQELKPLILDNNDYFSNEYDLSLSRISYNISQTLNTSGTVESKLILQSQKFLELYRRCLIFNDWFYLFIDLCRMDTRKENFNSLMVKINNLNFLFRRFENEIIRDFKSLIDEIGGIPMTAKRYYPTAKDGLNQFFTDYEKFLKKCQRELKEAIISMSFERLE